MSITIEEPVQAFMILGSLQLAYRYIEHGTPMSSATRLMAIALQKHITTLEPELTEVLEAGWHPECWDYES